MCVCLCGWGCACVCGTQKDLGEGHRVTLHADSATLNIPSALGNSFPSHFTLEVHIKYLA